MIPFRKYSGAGNDFVVVVAADLAGLPPDGLARRMCPRSTGVGVDGLALVNPVGPGEVGLRFFNPDGSEFATCGNGSRCAALWARDAGRDRGGRVDLHTEEGTVRATVHAGGVRLGYRIEAWVEGVREVPLGGEVAEGWLVRVGTPHLVLPVDRLPDGPIEPLCRPIRSHPGLGPEGANVNLVEPRGSHRARIRTYERGVEAETLACGAGSMATALALHRAGSAGCVLHLETRGGDELEVALEGDAPPAGDPARRSIALSGPARFVFEGRFPEPGPGPAGRRRG